MHSTMLEQQQKKINIFPRGKSNKKPVLYEESKCKFETFVKWNKELLLYLFSSLVLVYKVFSRHVSTVKPKKKFSF